MGQKTNPVGLRLGIHRKWNSSWYVDFINYSKCIYINFDIEKFFKGFLDNRLNKMLLINCKIIKLPTNHLYIFVFFYKLRLKKMKLKKQFNRFNKNDNLLSYNVSKEPVRNLFYNKFIQNFINNKYKNKKLLIQYKHYDSNISIDQLKILLKDTEKNLEYNINDLRLNLLESKIITNFITKNKITINKYNKFYNKINHHNKSTLNIIKLKTIKINLIKNLIVLLSNKQNNTKNFEFKINLIIKKLNNIVNVINIIKQENINNIVGNKFKSKLNFIGDKILDKIILENNPKGSNNLNFKSYVNELRFKKNSTEVYGNDLINKKINIKKFLTKLTNFKTSILFINSLSFANFYYTLELKNSYIQKNPDTLANIRSQMVKNYRYSVINIEDFVNIAFMSFLFKNTQILTEYISYQFESLPKNKRQLALIRFIRRVLQIMYKERTEIKGFRIKFKGRINKRKRARAITFTEGTISLQSHESRVEYSYTKAYTKSGLIGIKLWISYDKKFRKEFKRNFLQYINYSKLKSAENLK